MAKNGINQALQPLFARPIAHRGLHNARRGIIENSKEAVAQAVEAGYGIEIDVQASADGEAIVFHDATLQRLTAAQGRVADLGAEALCAIPLKDSASGDRLWRLSELLALVEGRVPLVIELKSFPHSDNPALARRVAELLADYKGPVAVKSFEPSLLRYFRRHAPDISRGIIACDFSDADHHHLSPIRRFMLRHMLHWPSTRPHFVSYRAGNLPAFAVRQSRARGIPVMGWTVRTPQEHNQAQPHLDQIIFENWRP